MNWPKFGLDGFLFSVTARSIAEGVHTMDHNSLVCLLRHYENRPVGGIIQRQQFRCIQRELARRGDPKGTHKPLKRSQFVKR